MRSLRFRLHLVRVGIGILAVLADFALRSTHVWQIVDIDLVREHGLPGNGRTSK